MLSNTGLFTPSEVHQIARAAAWLRIINEFDVKKARKLGFKSIKDFRQEVFKRCLNEQTATPPLVKFKKGVVTSVRWLVEKLAVSYKEDGISCLIHGGMGNVNREKKDQQINAKLIQLASEPVKYSWEDLSLMYNDWAEAFGKEMLTTSTIKQHLNTPKIKKVWYYARHGKHAADNELQPLINRETPSFPDALWSIDGTTMQLYYLDENGKIKSDLYAYFVTDANSGAILGYSVAFAENSGMVEDALRNAIITYENKPFQIQYDNSSANISYTVQHLMSNMSRVHFPCEPYKGRSKYVESIIGHFQQRELRKLPNFKGGNITTKHLNSKANPELLAFYKKNPEKLPNREGVLEQFHKSVKVFNNRGEKRDQYGRFYGSSKLDRYTTIEHEKREKLNYFDRLSLFMIEQRDPYPYTTDGIKLSIKGKNNDKAYHFIVPDGDGIGDFIFSNENLGNKFKVRIDKDNPDMIALYKESGSGDKKKSVFVDFAYNKERYAACVADMKEGKNAKYVLFKQKQEEWGQDYSVRELEKQMITLGEMQATGTEGFGWWDSDKIATNANEAEQEDVANGMSDGYSERQRKILNIGK